MDLEILSTDPLNAAPRASALREAAITPVERFFIRNHAPTPVERAVSIALAGLVERPGVLTLEDLASFEQVEVVATLACAGNRRRDLMAHRPIPGEIPWGITAVGTAAWGGVRLRDVLDRAGVRSDASHVRFLGDDETSKDAYRGGFGGSIPLEKARSDEVLLATSMNGEALTPDHGAPVRAVVPGYIGARSVKWLSQIDVAAEPSDNPFQSGYRFIADDGEHVLGAQPVNSAIWSNADGDRVSVGPLVAEGYAFTGNGSGIASVEVSFDDGRTWAPADLGDNMGPWAWRVWRARGTADAGDVAVLCRATDGSGATQPPSVEHTWNPKGYVNNAWHRVVVRAG